MPTIVTRGAMSAKAFGFTSVSLGRCSWVALLNSGSSPTSQFFSVRSSAIDAKGNAYFAIQPANNLVGCSAKSTNTLLSILPNGTMGKLGWYNYNGCGCSPYASFVLCNSFGAINNYSAVDNNCNVIFPIGIYGNPPAMSIKINTPSCIVTSSTIGCFYSSNAANQAFFDKSCNFYMTGVAPQCVCCVPNPRNYISKFSSNLYTKISSVRYTTGNSSLTNLSNSVMDKNCNIYQGGIANYSGCTKIFISKFNSSLSKISIYQGTPTCLITGSLNNVYFSFNVDNSGNYYGIYQNYLFKINSCGTNQWTKKITNYCTYSPFPASSYGGVRVDKCCNIYFSLYQCSPKGLIVIKTKQCGTVLWQRRATQTGTGVATQNPPRPVQLDYSGNGVLVSIAGYTACNIYGISMARLPNDGSKTGSYPLTNAVGISRTFNWSSTSFTIACICSANKLNFSTTSCYSTYSTLGTLKKCQTKQVTYFGCRANWFKGTTI
jgi:hypothetical protein